MSEGVRWHLNGGGGDELFQTEVIRLNDTITDGQVRRAWNNGRCSLASLMAQPRLLAADLEPTAIRRLRYRGVLAPWLSTDFKESVRLTHAVTAGRTGARFRSGVPRRATYFGGLGGTALDHANNAAPTAHYGCFFLSPFLDVDLILLALRIPEEMRIARGDSRYLQRLAFRDYLPPELLARRGKAYFDPRHTRDLGAPWVRDAMHDLVLEQRGILDGAMVRRMWQGALDAFAADPATPAPNTAKVWQILLADMWVRGELERRGAVTSS